MHGTQFDQLIHAGLHRQNENPPIKIGKENQIHRAKSLVESGIGIQHVQNGLPKFLHPPRSRIPHLNTATTTQRRTSSDTEGIGG